MKSLYLLPPCRHRSGVALVIVLAFIVLLTGLVVAYLGSSNTDHQLANNSVVAAGADQLAVSALDVVVGDLKQEIVIGSSSDPKRTINNRTVYLPGANANMLPARSGNPAIVGGVDPIPNFVRISNHMDANAVPSATSPLVGSRASNLASTTASGGRSVSLKRWNKHFLIPRGSSVAGNAAFDSTPTTAFTPPDWVFVTNQGPQVITAPTTSVVGRYAYTMYDEGGILDANVAGYPSTSTPSQIGGKGNIAYADLTTLTAATKSLTKAQVDTLVGWRNHATTQPGGSFAGGFTPTVAGATSFLNMVSANGALGFLKVAPAPVTGGTDQAFLSRQQLIDFWKAQSFPPDVLQFLGTFSRESNAPSWSPLYDAITLGGSSTYAYKTNAENTASPPVNPDVLNWRFSANGTLKVYAADGTLSNVQVKAGDPLIRRRFSLGRINWLTPTGPNPTITNAAAAIKQHFGLIWGTDAGGLPCWVYTSPTGTATTGTDSTATHIMTLAEVAAVNPPREPDFFELLKAGILNGSLGKDGGPVGRDGGAAGNSTPAVAGPAGDTQQWDQTPDYQILQIAANIIDQYDTDSYPTEIAANIGPVSPVSVYGIENLPYLYRVYFGVVRDAHPPDPTVTPPKRVVGLYIPEVWNPHQNLVATSTNPTATSIPTNPSQFRIVASGTVNMVIYQGQGGTVGSQGYSISAPTTDLSQDTQGINFTINPLEPTVLTQANATTQNSLDQVTSASIPATNPPNPSGTAVRSYPYIGLYVGSVTDPDALTNLGNYGQAHTLPTGVTLFLQYKDAAGSWRAYSLMRKLNNHTLTGSYEDLGFDTNYNPVGVAYSFVKSDPRTDRGSVNADYQTSSYNAGKANQTTWTDPTIFGENVNRYLQSTYTYLGSGGVTAPVDNRGNPWMLSENRLTPTLKGKSNGNTDSVEYYSDPDGVNRRADGAYAVKGSVDGHPLATATKTDPTFGLTSATGSMASRPVMLNRPFRSVGELGYACRDLPWKNLDFFTPESADNALLDLFSVDDGDLTAGRVNLNTRQPLALQAILTGATRIEPVPVTGTSTYTTATEAAYLASAITTSAATTPFISRAELVSRFKSGAETTLTDMRFTSNPALTYAATTTAAQTSANIIKSQRESIVRGLADATSTRTWNLLIDVVAQTGHYPPGSTSLSQFAVNGERRYWLHVAIDRFTGEVVDRVLEPVYE